MELSLTALPLAAPALALSRLTGIPLYHFKCAWFDDAHYFDFYPRAVVEKRGGQGH